MVAKNSEARKCTNTNRASIENNHSGNIDMNIVAKSELNFHGKELIPVENITGVWLTSSDLARALEYSNSRAVTMIYNKYADEFTSGMTQVLEMNTSGNYRKKVRVFSLRGAHLIAMFARTPVAKEFRRWVLDILDREVAQGIVYPVFDFDMHARNAGVANKHAKFIRQTWEEQIRPALLMTDSPLASKLGDRIAAITAITHAMSMAMEKRNVH